MYSERLSSHDMVYTYLRDIGVLRGIHEAAPEYDVEPDEEDRGGEAGLIGTTQERSGQRCFKNECRRTSSCPNQKEWTPPESINLAAR